jgi:hypothetical protein
MDLLKMYSCPGFDFPLFYRHLGEEQLSHWFDPFTRIILKGFGGGRVVQKSGSVFDPNNPLRKYHGFIKIQLTDTGIVDAGEKKKSTPYRKIKDLTNPKRKRNLTASQKTKAAGGRYIALMCIIEHKRKVPTIFYHTTLAQDIPRVKDILKKISKKLNLEAGLRIQEGHLF